MLTIRHFIGWFALGVLTFGVPAPARAEHFQVRFRGGWESWRSRDVDLSTLDSFQLNLGVWAKLDSHWYLGVEAGRLQRKRYIAWNENQYPGDVPPVVNFNAVPVNIVATYQFLNEDAVVRPYISVGGGAVFTRARVQLPFGLPEDEDDQDTLTYRATPLFGFVRAGFAVAPSKRFAFTFDSEYHLGGTMDWQVFGEPEYESVLGSCGFALRF